MLLLTSCQQNCMTYTIAVCTVKTPDDGRRNCPKHVEFQGANAPAHKLLTNLYDIYYYRVYSEKLLMMDGGTVRNM